MIRNRILTISFISFIFLLFILPPKHHSLISVFRITNDPTVITQGSSGTAITVNISFGDAEVEKWLMELEKPYPLLFIDMDWANRFPKSIQTILENNIPIGLLGHSGDAYENNAKLFTEQLEQFRFVFDKKPLWFRTMDEKFPEFLHTLLQEEEINALGSSYKWNGEGVPPILKGEIISIPHHRKEKAPLESIQKITQGRDVKSIEDVLFGTSVKTKKFPK